MKTVWIVQSCRPSTEGDILCNIRAFSDLDSAKAFKVEINNKYSLFLL